MAVTAMVQQWAPAHDLMRSAVTESTWGIWLCELHPHQIGDGQLLLGAPEQWAAWVRGRFMPLLRRAAGDIAPAGIRVEACVGGPVPAELRGLVA